MKRFTDSRRILWLGGFAVLVLGVLVAFAILPTLGKEPGAGAPEVRVPKMENIPPERAPRAGVEIEKTPQK